MSDSTKQEYIVKRGNEVLSFILPCYSYRNYKPKRKAANAKSIAQMNIAYLKISDLNLNEIQDTLRSLIDKEALIRDLRTRPKNGITRVLPQCFLKKETAFAKTSFPNLSRPGEFYFSEQFTPLSNELELFYPGIKVILVNERTKSMTEYLTMAIQASNNTITIGSQTAGADGNITNLILPGAINTTFTSIGIFYPDGTETQGIGINIDYVVQQTKEDLILGNDVALNKAVEYLIGRLGSKN